MGNSINRNEVIDLSKEKNQNGVYIYDICHEEDNALMSQVYKQAFRRIGKVVEKCSYRNYKGKPYDTCNNIIPIIGGRGTGKSSALESINHFLPLQDKESVRKRNELLFGKEGCNLSPEFIVLKSIDADLLLPKESLFEKVLVLMYSMYQKYVESSSGPTSSKMDYDQRILATDFEKVYRSFCERRKTDKDGSFSIQKLSDASSRVNLRDEFFNLVEKFTHFISKGSKNDVFLVIPIDDLDVNIEYAYYLSEEIYQYLTARNIIVLVTMELTQFSYICEKHFAGIVPTKGMIIEESKERDKEQYWKKYTSKITQNYVDKILPAENRIHLPGIHNENRIVHLKNFEAVNNGLFDEKSAKWVIFYKIFRRTGIICDGKGKKKHYYEPDTIRKVVSFIGYLNQMEPVFPSKKALDKGDEDNKSLASRFEVGPDWEVPCCLLNIVNNGEAIPETKELLKTNIEMMYKDIVERLENEKLQPERKEVFDEIRRQHRCRQHIVAFKKLKKELVENMVYQAGNHIETYYDFLEDNEVIDKLVGDIYYLMRSLQYSYGNYQYMLNEYSTRVDKQMTHMIIALQTANMTSLYNSIMLCKRSGDKEKEEEYFKDLRQIIGDSLSGEWFGYILNNAHNDHYWNPNSLDMLLAERNDKDLGKDLFRFKRGAGGKAVVSVEDIEQPFTEGRDVSFTVSVPVKNDKEPTQLVADVVTILAETALSMLPDGIIEIKIDKMQRTRRIEVSVNVDSCHMDELGFVMWFFDNKIERRNRSNLKIIVDPKSKLKPDLIEKVYRSISANREKELPAALPFYSQDVFYNLLKRLKENKDVHFADIKYDELLIYEDIIKTYFKKGNVSSTNYAPLLFLGDSILETEEKTNTDILLIRSAIPYLKVLLRIKRLLGEEDKFYNEADGSEENLKLISLEKDFLSCKFVENLLLTSGERKPGLPELTNIAFIGELFRTFYVFGTDKEKNEPDDTTDDSEADNSVKKDVNSNNFGKREP